MREPEEEEDMRRRDRGLASRLVRGGTLDPPKRKRSGSPSPSMPGGRDVLPETADSRRGPRTRLKPDESLSTQTVRQLCLFNRKIYAHWKQVLGLVKPIQDINGEDLG